MTNSGIVIVWQAPGGPEYLLTDDGDYWHFETIDTAKKYLSSNENLSQTDPVFKHHVHCIECHKEHFFDPMDVKTDDHGSFFLCDGCQCPIST